MSCRCLADTYRWLEEGCGGLLSKHQATIQAVNFTLTTQTHTDWPLVFCREGEQLLIKTSLCQDSWDQMFAHWTFREGWGSKVNRLAVYLNDALVWKPVICGHKRFHFLKTSLLQSCQSYTSNKIMRSLDCSAWEWASWLYSKEGGMQALPVQSLSQSG